MARRLKIYKMFVSALLLGAIAIAPDTALGVDLRGKAFVIDGDTVIIKGQKIRLIGIDAVEKNEICFRDGVGWNCGVEATNLTRSLAYGRIVMCSGTKTGHYGRLIAKCYAKGIDLGKALVKAGLAIVDRAYYERSYIEEENKAKSARRGIWYSGMSRERTVLGDALCFLLSKGCSW